MGISTGCHCEWIWFDILSNNTYFWVNVRYGSARKYWRKFYHKLQRVTIQNIMGIHELNSSHNYWSLLNKKPVNYVCLLKGKQIKQGLGYNIYNDSL